MPVSSATGREKLMGGIRAGIDSFEFPDGWKGDQFDIDPGFTDYLNGTVSVVVYIYLTDNNTGDAPVAKATMVISHLDDVYRAGKSFAKGMLGNYFHPTIGSKKIARAGVVVGLR